jgi:hypothetical protein
MVHALLTKFYPGSICDGSSVGVPLCRKRLLWTPRLSVSRTHTNREIVSDKAITYVSAD